MALNVDPIIAAFIKEREGIDREIVKIKQQVKERSASLRQRKKDLNVSIAQLAKLTNTSNERLLELVPPSRLDPKLGTRRVVVPCPLSCGVNVPANNAESHLRGKKYHGDLSDAKVEQTVKKIQALVKLAS